MDAQTPKPVKIAGTTHVGGVTTKVTIENLTGLEGERLEGMFRGQWWMKSEEGRLQFVSTRTDPPPPTDDDMLPQWRRPSQDQKSHVQREIFADDHGWRNSTPSILIQHLCGYNYSETSYKFYAEQLEGIGFSCLRSRRGDDGRFWEIWFLPGLWAAKGRLKKKLEYVATNQQLAVALEYLRTESSSFGTLDICVQRMAQVRD